MLTSMGVIGYDYGVAITNRIVIREFLKYTVIASFANVRPWWNVIESVLLKMENNFRANLFQFLSRLGGMLGISSP